MHILGLDIGTSGVKAILFDETWKAIGQSYREYHLISAGEDRFDLDAETVWKKTREAIIEIADSTGQAIDAVAVSALGDVIISLDERGNTVRPSILDFDPRGKEEIQGFIEDFGAERFYKITGMPPIHINSLAKILWIKKHEPHNYRRVRSWATYEDYVLRKLGVRPTISYSMAARTMLFDSTHKTWSQEVLTAAGLEEGSFPKAVPSGMVIDTLRRDVSRELGFSRDAVACSGGHDMVCAAIGAGLDEGDPHTALNIVGTMEGVIVLLQKPKVNREMLKRLYPCYPGYREYISLSVNLTSGSVVKWYRDVISYKTMGNGEEKSFEELLQSIDEKEPGNLFLIPHFSGTCNPVFDPGARGFFYGLSLHTTMQDLIQGIIEGLCYELKMHIQGFNDAGISIEGLKTVGGGSQSSKWLQLKANITGLEIISSDTHEASAMGAAALCGVALGLIDNPYEVSSFMGVKEKRYAPSPQAAECFNEKFAQYQELNETLHRVEAQ